MFFMFCWNKELRLAFIDDCQACRQYGSIHRLVGGKLNQYTISTEKDDETICTRVLTVIFTEYNRGFCLSLRDPGGRSYECSSDHQPMTLFFFQPVDNQLVTCAC